MKELAKPTHASLLALPVDVDLIRFEKNLLQIGFFGAHETRGKGKTSRRIEQLATRDGHKVKVAAEFRGSEALGLPSTTDRDKFIALLKIMSEERTLNGQIKNPVRFSGYRLIQELGLARNGEIYEEILRWGRRMTDTTITSEQVVYFAAKKVYSDETLHVFRSFRRTGSSRLDGVERQEQYEVVLEDWLLENLNQRYVIPEDFNAYKQLTRPTAKGIFGNLHLWFHASQGRPVEKDYAELCNLLNVQVYPHLSKIRSTMGHALDELVGIGYVKQWSVAKMVSKQGFKIVLWPGEKILCILQDTREEKRAQSGKPTLPKPGQATLPHLVTAESLVPDEEEAQKRLTRHGIPPLTAQSLINCYGTERVQQVATYIEEQLARPAHKILNPAGLLIHALENALELPKWCLTKRQDQEVRQKERELTTRREQEEFAYAEWLNAQKEDTLAAQFTPEGLAARLEEVAANQAKMHPQMKRWTGDARRIYARNELWNQLKSTLKIPPFEEWILARSQTKPSI